MYNKTIIDEGLICEDDKFKSFTVVHSFLFSLFKVKMYFEYRGNKCNQYKLFIDVKMFNKTKTLLSGLRIDSKYIKSMYSIEFLCDTYKSLEVKQSKGSEI